MFNQYYDIPVAELGKKLRTLNPEMVGCNLSARARGTPMTKYHVYTGLASFVDDLASRLGTKDPKEI